MLALLTLGLAVLALQTVAVTTGLAHGQQWVTRILQALDGLTPGSWAPPVAILLGLAGLWLLFIALRPRPAAATALRADTGVFLRPRDVARIARDAAEDVDGVDEAHVSATRRKVAVQARITGGGQHTNNAIKEAVMTRLEPLSATPRVKIKTSQVHP